VKLTRDVTLRRDRHPVRVLTSVRAILASTSPLGPGRRHSVEIGIAEIAVTVAVSVALIGIR
jgi:hypothetical protein